MPTPPAIQRFQERNPPPAPPVAPVPPVVRPVLSAFFPADFDLIGRLKTAFPTANFPDEIEVTKSADGTYAITGWNLPRPVPSQAEIEAVVIPEPNLALTARQARLWLLSAGLDDEAVAAKIDAIPDEKQRAAALIEWEYSAEIHLNHPLVQSIGASLGLTPAQLRAAFTAAAAL